MIFLSAYFQNVSRSTQIGFYRSRLIININLRINICYLIQNITILAMRKNPGDWNRICDPCRPDLYRFPWFSAILKIFPAGNCSVKGSDMNLLEIILFIFDSQSEIFNIFRTDRIDTKNPSTCFEESLYRDHKLITEVESRIG